MAVGAVGKFSTLQSIVALVAGLSSIGGATYSALGNLRSTPAPGEIVAVVREAGTSRPVPGAVVEVATSEDTLVTMMIPGDDGLARRAIAPGEYHVRVRHPAFTEAVREVQVVPDGTAELHVMLEQRARPDRTATAQRPTSPRMGDSPVDAAVRALDRGASTGRRLLGRLGL